MLRQVARGVLVHESRFCESNAVVVQGASGVLLIDPGVHADELECLANDLAASGQTVVAGFSTHPHWDHLLWHPAFGDAPRYATATGATTAKERLAGGIDAKRFGIPDDVPLDLLDRTEGLPADAMKIPWDGPTVRIIEHSAHAPGHAALFVEDSGVLVAGDMLSDGFIPMLDLNGTADPIGDYLAALVRFEAVADSVDTVIPGHGSVSADVRQRIGQDRAYLLAVREGREPDDPRISGSAKPGWEWVADVHRGQVARLAASA
jgi:glyoxylase-like metal-dependent hydrolase (beta-lactamase superfamily II)